MEKITKPQALALAWSRGNLFYKCHAVQKEMYKIFYDSCANSTLVWLLARQSGKCLEKHTLIMTPTGSIEIQNLKAGDIVYGYNKDGSISETKVLKIENTGEKQVVDLLNHNRVMATASLEHRWQVYNTATNKIEEKTTKELGTRRNLKILRKFVDIPLGQINEPRAYAIGAMLGDGYSKQSGNIKYISSEDKIIPEQVSKILECNYYKNGGSNYTWSLAKNYRPGIGNKAISVHCNYYNEWCHDRYAHEKIIDLEVIKTWDRKSCVALLAGLIDTDGSLQVCGRRKNELKISYASQSRSIIETVKYLFLTLWQIDLCEQIDNRSKYVNGPCFTVYSNNNLFVKRCLKELDLFLVCPRKKWKPEYEFFKENNTNSNYVGVKLGSLKTVECYDIQVSNETNLYLLANGLVTHNSVLLAILALEQAYRKPNSIIKILTDTKVHAKNIFQPIFQMLTEDCPEQLKPRYLEKDYAYYAPNGSIIQLAGSDSGHYERLRGQKTELVLVDEAAFCNNLRHIVMSILFPTTTHTGGKIVLASTPSEDVDHDFTSFIEQAELRGTLSKKTIYDNPLLNEEQRQRIIDEMGGVNSSQFRREYLCQQIKENNKSVLPEFTPELEKEIVKEFPKPPFKDYYVSMDLGGKDLTVVLFAYYDFRANKVIIEDELIVDFNKPDSSIKNLVEDINKKETELFFNYLTNEKTEPVLRVSDINYIVLGEIAKYSFGKLNFQVPKKDDKDAALHELRLKLSSKQIIIHPKCQTLIRHCRNVKWHSSKKTFARSADDSHYDAVDALLYLIRSISYNKNPYPSHYGYDKPNMFVQNPEKFYKSQQDMTETYKKIFNVKRSKS